MPKKRAAEKKEKRRKKRDGVESTLPDDTPKFESTETGQIVRRLKERQERQEQHGGVPDRILEKYGESILSEEFFLAAGLGDLERERFNRGLSEKLPSIKELILKQQRDFHDELYEVPIPGTRTCLSELVQQIRFANLLDPTRKYGFSIPDIWQRLITFSEAQESFWGLLVSIESELPLPKPGRRPPANPAFGRSCYEVGEWIRRRHRNTSGELDGRVCWPDVAAILEWCGHDLTHIKSDKGGACRKAAVRHRATMRTSPVRQKASTAR